MQHRAERHRVFVALHAHHVARAEMDAWRRDGRHQITMDSNATGLVATCGNTKLQVPRAQLGKAAGEIGLYAFNDADAPVTVQFCAFAVGK